MTQSLMIARRQKVAHTFCFAAALLLAVVATSPADAQVITMKTLPVAEGDQFTFFPSANFGMGISLAVADSIHDPFVNPAKGARIPRSFFFGAPTAFSVSHRAGNGSTLPAGIITKKGSSFAGAAIAIQSVTDGRRAGDFDFDLVRLASSVSLPPASNEVQTHSNRYGFLIAGHSFQATGISIGGSALWSGLGAVDGVNLLYPDSRSVSQSGGFADVRLGALKEWRSDQSAEVLLVYRRENMAHEVTYADNFWDPVQHFIVQRPRTERGRERADTRGLHLAYQRRLADSTWRVGLFATTNLLDYPSTARYDVAAVASDEGRATAFNFGVGVARRQSGTTYALDAVYEPIVARLWGVADSAAAAGGTIAEGERILENRLRFANAVVRAGVSHELALEERGTAVRLQTGLQARSIFYTLRQHDLETNARRRGDESWMEWTRSWSAAVRLSALEVQYRGRLTTGGSRPGIRGQPVPPVLVDGPRVGIADPVPGTSTTFTTMSRVSVTSHQISISLPIR